MSNTGERFAAYLKHREIGVNEAGRLLEVSGAQVSKIIKGSNFGVHLLSKIVNVFPDIDMQWLVTGKGKMIKENSQSDVYPNVYPDVYPKQKKPLPEEEDQENLNIPFSISPQKEPPGVREHPEPYGKKTDPPPGCALCHANERVIAAMQAHIDTLERELHRQQVISDELREQQLHQQEAQKNDRHESGQKRKAG